MRRNRRVLRLTAMSFLLPVPVAMAAPQALTPAEQVLAMAGLPTHSVGDAALPRVPSAQKVDDARRDLGPSASLTQVAGTHEPSTASAGLIARSGIPLAALRAYRTAEATMRVADPSCRLSWGLLAGIGRVESDHGRYGGAVVGRNGVSTPQILGVPLNGVGAVAAIADTDNGQLDGDRQWDRAVGPMQFIPSTWAMTGVDGDGDGRRNPHDLDDAALAAAAYLCVGDDDLSTPEGLHDAVLSYNHSEDYVALVAQVANAYEHGVADLPQLTTSLQLPTGPGKSVALRAGDGARAGDDGVERLDRRRGSEDGRHRGRHGGEPDDSPRGPAHAPERPRPDRDDSTDPDRSTTPRGDQDDQAPSDHGDDRRNDDGADVQVPAEQEPPAEQPADEVTPAPDPATEPATSEPTAYTGTVTARDGAFYLDDYLLGGTLTYDGLVGQVITVMAVLEAETLVVDHIVE